MGNKTFIRITNQDIYAELRTMHGKLDDINTKVKIHDIIFRITGLTMLASIPVLIFKKLK